MKKDESIANSLASEELVRYKVEELVRYKVEGIDKNGAATKLITIAYNEEEAIQRMKDLASDKNFIDIICKVY